MLLTWIILLLVIIITIINYNYLIKAKNSVEENKSTIDVVLKNRYELVPKLVKVVKLYTKHEKTILEELTKIRIRTMKQKEITDEKIGNEKLLSKNLKSIFAVSENYPDLKSNVNFLNLQEELKAIENNLVASRRSYNTSVKRLNILKESIPSNIVAMFMNIKDYHMFKFKK